MSDDTQPLNDFIESMIALISDDVAMLLIVRGYVRSLGLEWSAREPIYGLSAMDISDTGDQWVVVNVHDERWWPSAGTEVVLSLIAETQQARAVVLLCAATGDLGGEWCE
jgi:hypothetical protein